MLVRRVVAAFAVCSSLAVTAGCAEDEPEPRMPEQTSSAPSPTPAETSDEPEQESAEDFIRRWVEVGDEMQVTGETAKFLAISRGCADCAAIADYVTRIYDRGGSVEFPGSEVSRLERTGDERSFELDLKTPETLILSASGAVDEKLPQGVGKYLISISKRHGQWNVANMGRR